MVETRQEGTRDGEPADEEPGRKLLELLVCPATKGPLEYDRERRELVSRKARLAYPIRNGVPLMTADAARSLDDDEPAGTPPRNR